MFLCPPSKSSKPTDRKRKKKEVFDPSQYKDLRKMFRKPGDPVQTIQTPGKINVPSTEGSLQTHAPILSKDAPGQNIAASTGQKIKSSTEDFISKCASKSKLSNDKPGQNIVACTVHTSTGLGSKDTTHTDTVPTLGQSKVVSESPVRRTVSSLDSESFDNLTWVASPAQQSQPGRHIEYSTSPHSTQNDKFSLAATAAAQNCADNHH